MQNYIFESMSRMRRLICFDMDSTLIQTECIDELAKKAGAVDSITLTGGCAKNDGLKKAIEKVLKINVVELKTDPQLMGALGAAEYARQKGLAKEN